MAKEIADLERMSPSLCSFSVLSPYEIDNTVNNLKENSNTFKNLQPSLDKRTHRSPSPSPIENRISSLARERWKILAKALHKKSKTHQTCKGKCIESMASVRRFHTFDLLEQHAIHIKDAHEAFESADNWYLYRVVFADAEFSINIQHLNLQLTPNDLIGFNNTGNVCVWPSEEALTVYTLHNLNLFTNKWILELGGGMTCLAGIMIAKYAKPCAVHLTDGNFNSAKNIRKNLCLNELNCYTKCSALKWENRCRSPFEHERFDYILSADCLFFEEMHYDLIDTVCYYLSPNGVALMMAPKRGNTFKQFIEKCLAIGLKCEIIEKYDDLVWQRHLELTKRTLYDEDIHYPVLIKLKK